MKVIKSLIIATIIVGGLALWSPQARAANTWYVDVNAGSNGTGTQGSPFNRWDNASPSVVAGDTVYFKGTVSIGAITVSNLQGSATAQTTLGVWPGSTFTISSASIVNVLSSVSYLTIDGWKQTGNKEASGTEAFVVAGNNVTLSNITCDRITNGMCLLFSSGTGLTVDNLTSSSGTEAVIRVSETARNATISNVTVTGWGGYSGDPGEGIINIDGHGVTITNASFANLTNGTPIHIAANNVTVTDSTFTSGGGENTGVVKIQSGDTITISDSTFVTPLFGSHGILLAAGGVTNNVTISGNTLTGISYPAIGRGSSNTTMLSRITVEDNTVECTSASVDGSIKFTYTSDLVLRRNLVKNCDGDIRGGMQLGPEVSGARIENNIFSGNTSGIQLNSGADDTEVTNNAFYKNTHAISAVNAEGGDQYVGNTTVVNNVFYMGSSQGVWQSQYGTHDVYPTTSDYNVYYLQDGTAFYQSGLTALSGWQGLTSGDTHSFETDPMFTSPDASDFSLQSDSLLIDAGDPSLTSATTDFVGNPQPYQLSAPDIGAQEYQAYAALSPPETLVNPTKRANTLLWTSARVGFSTVWRATAYQITYGTDTAATNGGTVVVPSPSIENPSATAMVESVLENLQEGTIYYWKVAAMHSVNVNTASSAQSFVTTPERLGFILTPDDAQDTNVRVVDVTGEQVLSFFAYDRLKLKMDATSADLNGDGRLEIITTPTAPRSANAHVRIFSETGELLKNLFPYGEFEGVQEGAKVAVGDFTGDEIADIAVIPFGAKSNLQVYTFTNGWSEPERLAWTFVYDNGLRSGSVVASGDVTGDLIDEIVVWNRKRSPNVQVFSFDDATKTLTQIAYIMPYPHALPNGADVTLADLDGNGTKELVTVPSDDTSIANMQLYTYDTSLQGTLAGTRRNMRRLTWKRGYAPPTQGGFELTAGDVHGDGTEEIVIATNTGLGGHILTYQYFNQKLNLIASFFPYTKSYEGGIHAVMADYDQDGQDELVTTTQNGNAPNTRFYHYTKQNGWVLGTWFYAFDPQSRFGALAD